MAALFLIIGLFSIYRTRRTRRLLLLAFTLITVGFIQTQSRGGLVALAGQMPGGALIDAVRSARAWETRRERGAFCTESSDGQRPERARPLLFRPL